MQCGPLSWLPWQVHSSLRSKMTQNSLCLLDLLSPSSLLSVCPRWRLKETSFHPSVFPSVLVRRRRLLGGTSRGILRVVSSPHVRFLVGMNGTSERGTKVCGCREEGDRGCVAFFPVRFAQIVYSSLWVCVIWVSESWLKLLIINIKCLSSHK